MTANASQGSADSGSRGPLHAAARIAVIAGAACSIGLMLRAGQHTPRFLLVLLVFWVLAPFVALAVAQVASWLIIVIVIPLAVLVSRRAARRGESA